MELSYPAARAARAPLRLWRRAVGYVSAVDRDLAKCVGVITGASSGIRRSAAHQFAQEGSRLLLAARSEGPLSEVAEECERLGASALAVPTDVRNEPGAA